MHEAKQTGPTYSSAAVPPATPGVVRVPEWELFPWLRHGFSTRAGGVSTVYRFAAVAADSEAPADPPASDLNLGWTADDAPEFVAENRRRFTQAIWPVAASDTPPALITVRQIHSAVTMVVAGEDPAALVSETGRALCEGDGLITTTPGLLLGVQTADCVPVLVVDTARRIVAAFHAGWRGTVARIVEHGVTRLQREFGSRPESLMAAIGPDQLPLCGCAVSPGAGERAVHARSVGGQPAAACERGRWRRPHHGRWRVHGLCRSARAAALLLLSPRERRHRAHAERGGHRRTALMRRDLQSAGTCSVEGSRWSRTEMLREAV
jgi:YfiH family protein